MCGIWGYAGNISPGLSAKAHDFLYCLASWSEVRGTDSAGFAARYDSGHVVVDKMPVRASVFGRMSHKFLGLRRKMPSTLIGHTRYGTGSTPIINNNNHPFTGNIFHMVHNGVIPSWRDYQRNLQLDMTSETDSEVIIRGLEKRLVEHKDSIPKAAEWVLENIYGNMAVALLELQNPNVWLFRNENPCWVFTVPDGIFGPSSVLFFSSTEEIFDNAWKETFKKGRDKFGVTSQYLDDNQLFRISTKPVKVNGDNQRHKFVVFSLDVKRKFTKTKTWYGGYGVEASGKYASSPSSNDEFFSHLQNPDSPITGCRFGKELQKKLTERMNQKDWEKVKIDGMPAKEYIKLRAIMQEIDIIEGQLIYNELENSTDDELSKLLHGSGSLE